MPWVVACFDLLTTPILDHCLAVRKLALQTGILEEETDKPILAQAANPTNTSSRQKESSLSADTMAPSAEEQRQGKAI